MFNRKDLRNKCLYKKRKYWYHISTTLKDKEILLVPWDNSKGFNRCSNEPDIPRICVAPTIAHCITALPYSQGNSYNIYRTKSPVKVNKPISIFDSHVTKEGWILKKTKFIKLGTINFSNIEKGEKIESVIFEAASFVQPSQSKKVLKWWLSLNLNKYIIKT